MTTPTILTANSFFNFQPPKPTKVSVPDLGGDVYVRVMSAAEKEDYEDGFSKRMRTFQDGTANPDYNATLSIRASLVIATACDESGTRLFKESDFAQLSLVPYTVLMPIFEAAQKVNGLVKTAVDDATKK